MSNEFAGPTLPLPSDSGQPPPTRPPGMFPVVGQAWGKFLIVKHLGTGGQAAVFHAHDQFGPLGDVALKVPLDPVPPEDLERWTHSEAEPLARVKHPNIVEVKDAGCVQGTPYVATQLVEGLPLNAHVKANPPSLRQALEWMVQLADAVHLAHGLGVVHRDLKPGNIIISPEGRPLLLDFGVATLVSAYLPEPSQERKIVGTVPFMAPEQARGREETTHQVDVFGLGGVLKYLLDGEGPYGEVASLLAVAEGKVQFARTDHGPRLLRALARIANRALAPDPQGRYRTAREMARALRAVRRRRLLWACVGAAALLAAAVALALVLWRPRPPTTLAVHFKRTGEAAFYHVLDPTNVPLRTGDKVQIHATLERRLVAYLVYVGPDGEPVVLYPPAGQEPTPVREIHVPPNENEWLPLTPPAGTETFLLLASPRPCADVPGIVRKALANGPPPTLGNGAILVVDEAGPRVLRRDEERGLGLAPVAAPKGFLAGLLERVPEDWTVVRALAFPHEPATRPTTARDKQTD